MKPQLKRSKYHQGKYIPKNPGKYSGDVGNIIYRSSWEKRLMMYLDEKPEVILWTSEQLVIPYISPIDNRPHRYFVDFLAKMKLNNGTTKSFAIEVKPKKEMIPPRKNKNQMRLLQETQTYLVNQAKWNAAKEACSKNNVEFIVLNEEDLGIK